MFFYRLFGKCEHFRESAWWNSSLKNQLKLKVYFIRDLESSTMWRFFRCFQCISNYIALFIFFRILNSFSMTLFKITCYYSIGREEVEEHVFLVCCIRKELTKEKWDSKSVFSKFKKKNSSSNKNKQLKYNYQVFC